MKDRARIGVIWPGRPPSPVEEEDLRAYISDAIELRIAAPSPPSEPPQATLERVLYLRNSREIESSAAQLRQYAPTAVAYACGTASYIGGPGGDAILCDRIRRATAVPATTTSTAMVEALAAVGARRVSVLSPHVAALNDQLRWFLEGSGFEVVSLSGLGLLERIDETPPDRVAELAAAADRPFAQAIYIACTSLPTAAVIDELERALNKPVLTANQVTMWAVLRLASVQPGPPRRGRLFSKAA